MFFANLPRIQACRRVYSAWGLRLVSCCLCGVRAMGWHCVLVSMDCGDWVVVGGYHIRTVMRALVCCPRRLSNRVISTDVQCGSISGESFLVVVFRWCGKC